MGRACAAAQINLGVRGRQRDRHIGVGVAAQGDFQRVGCAALGNDCRAVALNVDQ